MAIKNGNGVKIAKALEKAWHAIQKVHPELPNVVFITGSGAQPRSLRLGHFWFEKWVDGPNGKVKQSELFIAGETIGLGVEQTLSTLLHEGAHALARVRGIKDVSDDGRRHLKAFKTLSEELGLEVRHSKTLGWSHTTLTDETKEAFASVLAGLENDLPMQIEAPGWIIDKETGKTTKAPKSGDAGEGDATDKKDRNNRKLSCGCGTVIRASKTVADSMVVECSECGEKFTER